MAKSVERRQCMWTSEAEPIPLKSDPPQSPDTGGTRAKVKNPFSSRMLLASVLGPVSHCFCPPSTGCKEAPGLHTRPCWGLALPTSHVSLASAVPAPAIWSQSSAVTVPSACRAPGVGHHQHICSSWCCKPDPAQTRPQGGRGSPPHQSLTWGPPHCVSIFFLGLPPGQVLGRKLMACRFAGGGVSSREPHP